MASRICATSWLLSVLLWINNFQGGLFLDTAVGLAYNSPPSLGIGFLVHPPSQVIVERAHPLLINCSGFSEPGLGPLQVKWLFEDKELPDDYAHHVFPNGSLYFEKFFFPKERKTPARDGNFSCSLHNKAGVLLSRPVRVVLVRMAKSFHTFPMPTSVSEGQVLKLRCQIHAVPPANLSWYHNDELLPLNSSRLKTSWEGFLLIFPTTLSDSGQYHCKSQSLKNDLVSPAAAMDINSNTGVSFPLEFLPPSKQQITAVAGDTVLLECSANGIPMPSFSWHKIDDDLPPKERHTIVPQLGLKIFSVESKDSGKYVCMASVSSPDGTSNHTISQNTTLVVLSFPTFIEAPVSQTRPTAQTARFECRAEGTPAPSVSWLRNGQPLYINGRIRLRAGNVLIISQTIASDAGIYQCMASNLVGTVMANARLVVNASKDQPGPPQNLQAKTLSSSSILLMWDPAASPSGLRIQAYTIHYLPTQGGQELQKVAANTSQVIDKLRPYSNYSFYVRAYNGRSASEQSDVIIHTTGDDIPLKAPKASLKAQSPGALLVAWNVLDTSESRGPIVGYRIHYRRHNQASYSVIEVNKQAQQYLLTGLEPNVQYDVRVMAGTPVGFPMLSDKDWPWETIMLPDIASFNVPMTPVVHLTVINMTTLEAEWVMPPENEPPVLSYKLFYRQKSHQLEGPFILAPNITSYILLNLAPHTWYEVYVLAANSHGEGREASRSILTLSNIFSDNDTFQVVEPPSQLEAEPVSPTSIHVSWKPPPSSVPAVYYTVRYLQVLSPNLVNTSAYSYLRSTNNEVQITDLKPYTVYEFSVRTHNSKYQQGPFSNKVECRTMEDVPSAPLDLSWVPGDSYTVRLSWKPPKQSNGGILGYQVLYNDISETINLSFWTVLQNQNTELSAVIPDLTSNILYYACVRAETSAGFGPHSSFISFHIPMKSRGIQHQTWKEKPQDRIVGVITGAAVGFSCLIICIIVIMWRNKCMNHWRETRCCCQDMRTKPERNELECVSPMLPQEPSPENAKEGTNGNFNGTTSSVHITENPQFSSAPSTNPPPAPSSSAPCSSQAPPPPQCL